MTTHDAITALAPTPEPLDPEWSATTLAGILADGPDPARAAAPWWWRTRRRAVALVAAGVVTLSAGAAVAVGGPVEVVRDAILDFSNQPNTTGNGLGKLDDPELVAQFDIPQGVFAIWIATSSSGKVCYASSDGVWDGVGVPTKTELEYGCGGEVLTPDAQSSEPLTRPDQLGGFFKDTDGPIVYGVSPYPDAVRVRVRGAGVDRTLPLRADSHGYGAAIPEASDADAVTLTFLDGTGRELGTRRWVAPIG
jgi:hypothetical protein